MKTVLIFFVVPVITLFWISGCVKKDNSICPSVASGSMTADVGTVPFTSNGCAASSDNGVFYGSLVIRGTSMSKMVEIDITDTMARKLSSGSTYTFAIDSPGTHAFGYYSDFNSNIPGIAVSGSVTIRQEGTCHFKGTFNFTRADNTVIINGVFDAVPDSNFYSSGYSRLPML